MLKPAVHLAVCQKELAALTCPLVLSLVDTLPICPGNPDDKFVELAEFQNGRFLSKTGEVNAAIDKYAPITFIGDFYCKLYEQPHASL